MMRRRQGEQHGGAVLATLQSQCCIDDASLATKLAESLKNS
ncbi:hypothetical protein ACO0LB_15165 [Undibacterium sp. SXout7W]